LKNQQLKCLENRLWSTADNLRANSKLTAGEYKDPLLGLILLRYASNRFEQAKKLVEASIPDSPRGKRTVIKEDFTNHNVLWLDEHSRYDYLAELPENADIGEALNNAMTLIEEANFAELGGILPKSYMTLETPLLYRMVRMFNEDMLKTLPGDVFGRIYEFFLMKFSMTGAGAQEGGEFFTPPSLVQLIVNLIEPTQGIIHDPACGSGGMFVQTSHFIEAHKKDVKEISVFGTELKSNNAKLAKMNLAIHGIQGKIIESNSFYSDPHHLIAQCDFVMANPPFNVKQVNKNDNFVKNDTRLFDDIGIPKADNGNYLWIQYFYHYLNEQGRAGFVMASSATDAGNTEKAIRQKLVETQSVDCIVSIANNFFYTLSLPCHIWFLDKGKTPENKDKVLMIDTRNTYRKVNTTLNDFSVGQQVNLSAIMKSYRGNESAIQEAIIEHQAYYQELSDNLNSFIEVLQQNIQTKIESENLKSVFSNQLTDIKIQCKSIGYDSLDNLQQAISFYGNPLPELLETLNQVLSDKNQQKTELDNQLKEAEDKKDKDQVKSLKENKKTLESFIRELKSVNIIFNTYQTDIKEDFAELNQLFNDWKSLMDYFPQSIYQDVEGFCKIVSLNEIKENDYSLTPGRYVGYSIELDESFDYQKRMAEIHSELAGLHQEASGLIAHILDAGL
jgi:type I restriction enzyme M protein